MVENWRCDALCNSISAEAWRIDNRKSIGGSVLTALQLETRSHVNDLHQQT